MVTQLVRKGPGRGRAGQGFSRLFTPIRWSDLPGTDWLLRSASDAVERPGIGFSCAGMISLIASFCGAAPTAMWGGIDCGFDRQGLTPLCPWLAVRSGDLKTPCIARVESGTPPAHEKGRSGQVNRAARALRTSWQRIKNVPRNLLNL